LDNVLIFQPISRETGLSHLPFKSGVLDEDGILVEECRRGDLSGFEKLYQRHGSRMKSVACNLLENTSDAEDAVQEAFLKVYRSMRFFQGQSSFSTWVYRILVNTCLDMRRKRRGREAPETGRVASETAQMVAPHLNYPLRLTLEELLGKLDGRLRQVFLLFEVEGFQHAEIANILDISEASSKHALFEAKRELRRLLSKSQGARGEA
jgi:RNA polymerase sigma-70 factor, ECF subfamily